jgi:hypothetical protein
MELTKPQALQILRDSYWLYHRKKYPDFPDNLRAFPPAFSDKTANGLTKMVLAFLKYNNYLGERISVTGRYIQGKPSKLNAGETPGIVRESLPGKWIKPSMMPGSADLHAVVRGRFLAVEVKIGHDRQSPLQKEYQRQVERNGGIYLIAKSFAQFLTEFYKIFGR